MCTMREGRNTVWDLGGAFDLCKLELRLSVEKVMLVQYEEFWWSGTLFLLSPEFSFSGNFSLVRIWESHLQGSISFLFFDYCVTAQCPRNPHGHTFFRYATHAIHVAFPSCFVDFKTLVHILFCHPRNLRGLSKTSSRRYSTERG